MSNSSPSVRGLGSRSACRTGAAIDFLVILLALATLLFWVAGQAYLAFVPVSASTDSTVSGESQVNSGELGVDSDDESEPVNVDGDADFDSRTNDNRQDRESEDAGNGGNTEADTTPKTMGGVSPSMSEEQIDELVNQRLESYQSDFESKLNLREDELKSQHSIATQQLKTQLDELINKLGQNEVSLAEQENKSLEKSDQILELKNQIQMAQQQLEQSESERTKLAKMISAQAQAQPEVVQPQESPLELEDSTASPISVPVFRLWTGKEGRRVEMAFLRWDNQQLVFIDKSNRIFKFPPSELSPDDQRLVESFKNQ
jgi:ethanolamine utilization protein EutQ (cupin superfamily)